LSTHTFRCSVRRPDPKALELVKAIRQWQAEDAVTDEVELARRDEARRELEGNLDRYRRESGMRELFPKGG